MACEVSADSDGTVTISIVGGLDIKAVPAVEAAVAPTLSGGPDRIVVDAGALEFADSSAIGLFIRWANLARYLEVRDAPPFLRGLILRMGLAQRIVIGPAPETATPDPV
jgi:anti-anti-sigma regulatory factor